MHYYQFNIADYRKDTAHLTPIEHYIYRQLIDWYYLDESEIPKKTQSVLRRLQLGTESAENLSNVLEDFFIEGETGWTHKRIDGEIEAYHAKAAKNKVNGGKGGRPKKQGLQAENKPKKTQVVSTDNPEQSENNPNQEPLTNNHKPITNDKEPEKTKPGYPDWFEDLWNRYPARSGSNEKRKALTAANARIKQGFTLDNLFSAVDRYAKFIRASGNENTPYVMQAVRFFGPGGNLENDWTPPPPKGMPSSAPQQAGARNPNGRLRNLTDVMREQEEQSRREAAQVASHG